MVQTIALGQSKDREGEHAEEFGGEVYSDVWGLAPVELRGGRKYYVTFIDDKSQLMTLYLLKTKDEVPWAYEQYKAWVEMEMGKKVKVLNSDRGGEYQGADFIEYLKTKEQFRNSMYTILPNTLELPNITIG